MTHDHPHFINTHENFLEEKKVEQRLHVRCCLHESPISGSVILQNVCHGLVLDIALG
jgi:hypothetical protein